jgi:hypothetical protein
MATSVDDVIGLYQARMTAKQARLAVMASIREVYEGKVKIDLPDTEEFDRTASIPNLLAQGLDQLAGRIASITPAVAFASEKPGQRQSDRTASAAAQTIQGWWQQDRLPIKMRQRARHLIGYSETPVSVRWDTGNNRPTWQVRDPMGAFPSGDVMPGHSTPTNAVFAFERSYAELVSQGFGGQAKFLIDGATRDTKFTVLEYVDQVESHLVLTSIPGLNPQVQYQANIGGASRVGVTMLRWNHNFGITPASIPTRIGLNGAMGQFDQMLGMYAQQATLAALEQVAIERGIFPDTYLVGRPNETPQIIDGPHDGRTGRINVITGGQIQTMNEQPGYMTGNVIDRLERAQRLTGGIPSEFGGESGGNIRTGRRGDAVLAAVVDFPVAEAQALIAAGLEEENRIAIKIAKAKEGSRSRTIYVGTANQSKPVTYIPERTFKVEEHTVSYPAVGADLNGLMIGMGQRVGMGTMSKQTAAEMDPFIADPETERDRIVAEGLEQAMVAGLQQQASSGQLPPIVLSRIMSLVKNDRKELPEAIEQALKEAQAAAAKEQAAQAPPPGTPDPMAMAAPGAEQALTGAQSPIPGATAGQESLSDLVATLRQPVMAVSDRTGQPGMV